MRVFLHAFLEFPLGGVVAPDWSCSSTSYYSFSAYIIRYVYSRPVTSSSLDCRPFPS